MNQRGMTLVEVMVAVAVVAISLLAAGQAMRALLHGSQRQEQVLLAQLCAENALVGVRLHPQFPPIGQSAESCLQMGQEFAVVLYVSGTANPSFRRVQAQVLQGQDAVLSLVTVVGRY